MRKAVLVIGVMAIFGGAITIAVGIGVASIIAANLGFVAMLCGAVGVVSGDPI